VEGGEVLLKNRDEAIMLVEAAVECGVLGGQAVMVKLQLGMCVVDGGGHQLSAEVKLPLSSQFSMVVRNSAISAFCCEICCAKVRFWACRP
jgi:hypothetical protein